MRAQYSGIPLVKGGWERARKRERYTGYPCVYPSWIVHLFTIERPGTQKKI